MTLNQSRLFFSPAKLNLFFQVLKKREDGYHEIASLYQAISLGDTLAISLAFNDSFSCSDPHLQMDEKNLVIKALNLFRQKTNIPLKVRIHLEKNIPSEAGLGGGSSNAATTLWALNSLADFPVDEKTFPLWGAEFGSDISFFFSTGTAMCRGRGEIFNNHTLSEPFSAWLAKPDYGSKTPAVYGNIDYTQLTKTDPDLTLKSFSDNNPIYFNDLEETAQRLEPRLKDFKRQLQSMGFSHVVMTGSGTAYFCLGNVTPKNLPNTTFHKIHNIQRSPGEWYKDNDEY